MSGTEPETEMKRPYRPKPALSHAPPYEVIRYACALERYADSLEGDTEIARLKRVLSERYAKIQRLMKSIEIANGQRARDGGRIDELEHALGTAYENLTTSGLERVTRALDNRLLAAKDKNTKSEKSDTSHKSKQACPACMGHGKGAKVTEPDVSCHECGGTGVAQD